jgi:type VI protein secretion system component VasK
MRLKFWTTAFMALGIGLLLALPWLVGPRPPQAAGQQAMVDYGLRVIAYFTVTCLVFLVAAFLAWRLVRAAREEFAKRRVENLRDLVEGALRDHERRDS